MNHESVTNRANDNAYLKVMEDIDWDVFYEQKMALQDVTDYLHRHKEQENGMFDRAAAWMEGIIILMDIWVMRRKIWAISFIPSGMKTTFALTTASITF